MQQILVIEYNTKIDYNTKINEIQKKTTRHNQAIYIITQEFNKLTSENFPARLAQADLASKTGTADFIKKDRF